jgi:CHAD domain-containing protein
VQNRLQEVTEAIEQAGSELCLGYQAEQLYALRVGMRRLRSLLKPIDSTRARRFRKAWSGFATVTNRARDWDVFLLASQELLSEGQYAAFERRHRDDFGACREAVVEMVRSEHWRRHLADWRQYLQHPNGSAQESAEAADPLGQALTRARAALAHALALDNDRAWHKLRIAVKEVRYQAESEAHATAMDPARAELLEHCKLLQSLLGRWHDCVVQLQMLDEFEAAPEHAALHSATEQRRIERLAAIEETVAGHPLFEAAGNS